MQELADRYGFAILGESWLPEVMVLIMVVVAVNVGAYYLLRHAEKIAAKTSNIWDDALISAAVKPLRLTIWLVGLTAAAGILGKHLGSPIFELVPPLRNVGVVACLAWFLVLLTGNVADNIVNSREAISGEVDRTTVDAVAKLVILVILVLSALMVMQTLGISIAGILAAGGIGGIAIGFAAKDILANFFGGLTIYLDRPFSVGDWVRSPDKDIEGTVEYINWRHTRIRRFNKNPVYVPNALFTTIVVENPSRMSNRRIKETIGIRYQDVGKMAAIVADVKAMLQNHPEIDTEQTLIVSFNEFADSSLNFFIYTFTRTTQWVRYHEIKQDVLLKVADIIAGQGAGIAFPTRTLYLEPEPAQGAA
ncbi:MAG: mechanosensitive ion channel family protein [Gallionellaceae bacterium]|nr:mechanosensitive ion channel family protein [Gallionellaceae bacterium]